MTSPYRLHYAPDNASLIIRLALEELGQPFETILIDRRGGALDTAAYRSLNPHGLIPVLETPDGPIFETGAILLWLADRHGALGPGPQAPDGRHLVAVLLLQAPPKPSDGFCYVSGRCQAANSLLRIEARIKSRRRLSGQSCWQTDERWWATRWRHCAIIHAWGRPSSHAWACYSHWSPSNRGCCSNSPSRVGRPGPFST